MCKDSTEKKRKGRIFKTCNPSLSARLCLQKPFWTHLKAALAGCVQVRFMERWRCPPSLPGFTLLCAHNSPSHNQGGPCRLFTKYLHHKSYNFAQGHYESVLACSLFTLVKVRVISGPPPAPNLENQKRPFCETVIVVEFLNCFFSAHKMVDKNRIMLTSKISSEIRKKRDGKNLSCGVHCDVY